MSTVVSALEVLISANTRDLVAGLRDADSEVSGFGQRAMNAMRNVGQIAGGGVLAVGAASANAAITWESAWVNVEKTVSGSEEELSALEESLRGMAQGDVLGAMENAHTTLAAIAASAGALGVETSAIDEFTASVAALSIAADDVSAEEIATAAAQFANVTGMDIASEIDNWANTIARLGNEGASTEGQIISFAQRLSALGNMGFEDQQILAYGAAMASLGLTSELGASNFTKSVSEMVAAAATGAPELQGFSEIAGVAADEFAELATTNPEAAFNAFIEGLAGMDSVAQLVALDNINVTGMEQQRVLMTLAAGYGTLTSSIESADDAWASGTDAMDEAERKADTTQGGINELMNNLNDLAITIGDRLLPGLNDMIEGLLKIVDGDFSGLADVGLGIAGILDNFLGTDIQGGFQAFVDSMSLLPQVIDILGTSIGITFDNVKRTFERFFIEMQIKIVEWIGGFRQTILDATGGTIDIAPQMNIDLTNLTTKANSMDTADAITEAIATQVSAGGIDLETLMFQDSLGRTINLSNALETIEFSINRDEMMAQFAAGFGEQGKQTITDAIEMALAQGDEGALEVLTPLANELEIDIAQIQADLQAAMAAQSFPVTVTADMTVMAGSMTLPNGMMGPVPPPSGGGAGGVPGTTNGGNAIIVNSYGQNPWQMSNLIQQTTSDSGVR